MANPLTIIVTGANRGIGHAICTSLLTLRPDLTLFATSRKGEDLGFTGGKRILYPRLDIASKESIRAFAKEVEAEGEGKVDVLINNAGVNLDYEKGGDGVTRAERRRRTLEVNYWGTREMCTTFLPIITDRIVNVSSIASQLGNYSPELQARFRDPNATFKSLDAIAEEYLADPSPQTQSYSLSKALLNSLTFLLARGHPQLKINCCCPGWIRTDMGRLIGSGAQGPPKTVEEGARIPVRLALAEGEDDVGSGGYWANESVRGKGEGMRREW